MSGYLEHALEEYRHACAVYDADPKPFTAHRRFIQFGIAAITLDAARAERGNLPPNIITEDEQAVALAYAIRCCPAHDIAEPVWKLKGRYRRAYQVAGMTIDLSGRDGEHFSFDHIGGPGALLDLTYFMLDRQLLGTA